MKKSVASIVLTMMLGVSLVMTGCGAQSDTITTEESILVDVIGVQKDTLTLSNQFVGTVMPQESVYIIPMAQGSVTATYFEVGDRVKAGDVLFEIDDVAAQLQLQQARLTYNNTKAQVDSSWTSANDQIESSVDQLEAQKTASLAQLQAAQTQYFSLKNSVEEGEEALKLMKEQLESLKKDELTDDEVIALARTMLEAMASVQGGMDMGALEDVLAGVFGDDAGEGLGGILGDLIGGGGGDTENGDVGDMTEEEKAELADQLRPTLISALELQIKEMEPSINQAIMSLNAARTAMDAAQEGYELLVASIEQAADTDLTDTKKQLDNSLSLASLAVESAELALSYYDVTTPISGTVISKAVEVNGFATASQPAYIIANDESMTVTFYVSEAIKNTLEKGDELAVERNGVTFNGVVTEVGNAVNQQTGLFQIKGLVYADGNELPSGVSVKLLVDTYEAEDAFVIPYDAVYYENDGAYVYVMKDGIAVKTPVVTGLFDDESIEIVEGLYLEDEVITSWSPRLIDGVKVRASVAEATN